MGTQGVLSPKHLVTGRLRVALDKEIYDLDIDKAPLLKLLSVIGKQSVKQMKFSWLTKERMPDWGTIDAFGGNWAAGAATDGTITVPTDEVWMYASGDLIKCPADSDVNLYIDSVNKSTGVLTCRTYDNTTTVDFSAGTTGANKLFLISNAFELGSGKGIIKTHQPVENYNYIQIAQTPYGVVETLQHVEYEAGGKEFEEQEREKAIEHAFMLEKTLFFGRKHVATTGYMNGEYEQYFTGGIYEALQTNIKSEADLTKAEFASWVKDSIRYAKRPVIFAGELIFEALTWWAEQKLQIRQDEKTLGMAVAIYLTPYGDRVKVIPHRELLKNEYAGWAFCIDLDDIRYRYLEGEDTHLEVEIQQRGEKKVINEYRTWFGLWIGNEKRHGVLKDVATISA